MFTCNMRNKLLAQCILDEGSLKSHKILMVASRRGQNGCFGRAEQDPLPQYREPIQRVGSRSLEDSQHAVRSSAQARIF